MTTPYSRIPAYFPDISVREAYNRKLAKSSLIRRLAEAQNFLWAHGRVYAANGYEGRGNRLHNQYEFNDARDLETTTDGRQALCVCSFLVTQNWNKLNTIKLSYELTMPAGGKAYVYAYLEHKNGSLINSASGITSSKSAGDVADSFTIDVPVTEECQIRVLISYDYSGVTGSEGNFGHDTISLNHVSARWEEDSSVDTTWFEFSHNYAFADYDAVSSVILNKLIRNVRHLWARRTPELCQAALGRNWNNSSTFTKIARYVSLVNHPVNQVSGQLVVFCTHSGANNEIRLKLNGTVVQTFIALSAGLQTLSFTPFAVTGNAEAIWTIEAKSTAAGTDYGTTLLGVQLWESGTTITSPPAGYKPLDFNGLEGDDVITAGTVNAFAQSSGINRLIQNDKWLSQNRLKVLVGDWCHKTLKNCVEFSSGNIDTRLAWTYGIEAITGGISTYAEKYRNMTVNYQGGDESADARATFASTFEGLADANSGYTAVPFIYPYSLTYSHHGARLGFYNIFQTFATVENAPQVLIHCRIRRVKPYAPTNDANGTGPPSADFAYKGKCYIEANFNAGVAKYNIRDAPGIDDSVPHWLLVGYYDHAAALPYNLQLAGRLPPQYEGFVSDGASTPGTTRPEGMLFEVELCSSHVADVPLSEASLALLF